MYISYITWYIVKNIFFEISSQTELIEKKVTILYYFSGMPDPPSCVSLTVASSSSLLVRFDEPLNHNGAVVTKYRGK